MPPPGAEVEDDLAGPQLGDGGGVAAAQAGEDGRIRQRRAVGRVVQQLAPGRVAGSVIRRAAAARRSVRVLARPRPSTARAASAYRARTSSVMASGLALVVGVASVVVIVRTPCGAGAAGWRQAGQQSVDIVPPSGERRVVANAHDPGDAPGAGSSRARRPALGEGDRGGGAVAGRRGLRRAAPPAIIQAIPLSLIIVGASVAIGARCID